MNVNSLLTLAAVAAASLLLIAMGDEAQVQDKGTVLVAGGSGGTGAQLMNQLTEAGGGIPAFHIAKDQLPLALKGSTTGIPTLHPDRPFGLQFPEQQSMSVSQLSFFKLHEAVSQLSLASLQTSPLAHGSPLETQSADGSQLSLPLQNKPSFGQLASLAVN